MSRGTPPRQHASPRSADLGRNLRMSRSELGRIVDFVEGFEEETAAALHHNRGNRDLTLMLQLIRAHLEGRLVTPSSLVAASGLSYGSGVRRVQEMIGAGRIVRRPRTRSGKTFSLHPSPGMIAEFQEYARRIKGLVGRSFGQTGGSVAPDDYYFGASFLAGQIIPPPSVLADGLGLQAPLRLLLHADPTFMAMDTLKGQFESILGVQIRSKALSIDRLRAELLAHRDSVRAPYDIVACDLPWFGEMAEKGVLAPLDDLIAAEGGVDLADYFPEALACTRQGGRLYGLPVQMTPELLFARTDLIEEAGLELPATTDALLETARRLHRPQAGRAGIAWNGARGTPVGTTFIMLLAAFGQPIIDLFGNPADGYHVGSAVGRRRRPMFQTDAARDTADFMLAMLDVSPATILHMSWFERAKCYAEGGAAMAYCYTLLAPLFDRNPAAAAHGRTAFLPHPAGPAGSPIAPIGGYALAIPSNLAPERRQGAVRALIALTGRGSSKLYVTAGSSVSPRLGLAGDPEVNAASPLLARVDQIAREGLLEYWPRPPIAELPEIIPIVGGAIHDMLCGTIGRDAALAAIQNRTDALMRARGHY